ncbi:FACT complex subunit SSRP1 isoform X1 [Sesamum indicum]|uniref:FACT complex subunit SSRP1 n=2 Tax=Sesamum indicum TaxID=4182 RepID=A0A6I9TK77_SESIN|nr:FACT complex subunit SSRP1 isoform X1 [Sesamum indicum]
MTEHSFNNISLGGRGGTNSGQLKLHSGGVVWKKQGGGKAVEVDKSDLLGLTWMKVPRSNQLGVRTKDGLYYKFTGFRDQDVASLTTFFQSNFGKTPEEKQLSISGKNWGEVDLNGNMLTFLVGAKQAFEISLADVAQTQLQGKNDVMLEFHVDDTTGANEKDSLMEISFHIPNSNTQFVGDESHPSAQVFRDKIVSMADVGAGGEEGVVTFDGIAILTPRGRYNIELHLSFLRLQGQANDFKIQYSSVVRVFWLPKSNQPHTFVVVTLDPPIRKGQTLYPHIVMQFETDSVIDTTLSIKEDLYNAKYKDKLKLEHKGLAHEIFITILRGLSGSKVTKPGTFRSHQDGYAVKSSLKAEDGVLYPLEKSFFFLPKPPTLILHEEIDYVEFERHTAGGSNMHYFDLLIRLKTEQEHLFRNIQRNEYQRLFVFVNQKGLKIMNLGSAKSIDGVASVLKDVDVDPHLERIKNEAIGDDSDEEDEDFVADKDDGGSPSDDSGEGESDASESGEEKEAPVKKKTKKEPSAPKVPSIRKKAKDGEDDGSKKKKQKKKKDPNAPKRAISAFMFFSQTERENVKKSNPGISFTEVGKVLGERWNKMTADEKSPYEAKARADKKRYSEEISGYKNPQTTNADTADAPDNA